jgi:hypothetical protein
VLVADVALIVLVEVLEAAELRALAGLLVWAEQRPLALTRAAAAINSLRAVFMCEVFPFRLVASWNDLLRGSGEGASGPGVIGRPCGEVNAFRAFGWFSSSTTLGE